VLLLDLAFKQPFYLEWSRVSGITAQIACGMCASLEPRPWHCTLKAMLREAFHLVESGVASVADVDRSLRNDLGYWITFAGPFRSMDLTGIPAYRAVMRDLLPDLDCSKQVPALMENLVESGAQGVGNAKGFYNYTPAQAKRWEKRFLKFSYDVRALARKYREDDGSA
jgi:3-hydroxybutyryl-CoA dehydrogenase